MPGVQPTVHQGRNGGQHHHRLGDPAARVVQHPLAQLGQLPPGRLRADHQTLAAGPVHRLEHQLVQPVERLLQVVRLGQPVGRHVLDHRLLAEVEAHQVRHVAVDQLVVGHAVAERVRDRHVPGPGRVHHSGDSEHRVGPELHRVDELVVHPAIDHIHRALTLGGPHPDPAGGADQVAALDQLHPHRAGQPGMLEVGAVVDAGGEHHHDRLLHPGRGAGPKRSQQPLRILRHRRDPLGAQCLGEHRVHRQPVRHHVADPGRHPDVVLQHPELALLVPDQVDPGDMHPDPVHRLDPADRPLVAARGGDHRPGHHPGRHHLSGAVHVSQEGLQRPDPLGHPGLHRRPLRGGDHPGDDVERERPLLTADVEGDALVEVGAGQHLRPSAELGAGQTTEGAVHRSVGGPGAGLRGQHLVPRQRRGAGVAGGRVAGEQARHVRNLADVMCPPGYIARPAHRYGRVRWRKGVPPERHRRGAIAG